MTVPHPAHPSRGHVRLATAADFEAIHRLNYRTFVEEIPQHPPNAERRLVDRFHDDNVYAVYEVDGRVVGMVSGRTQRPFSLDQKLGAVDPWLPPGARPVEIRLLAVEPAYRATRVFVRLVGFLTQHFMTAGYDVGIMSGTTRQLRLYRHMGFEPFAQLVGTAGAQFQPMYITRDAVARWSAALAFGGNFQSGPVSVADAVRRAFETPPASHRSEAYRAMHHELQQRLCALTHARFATVLLGSGTLANDVVGAQLRQLATPGVILSNGEFGERLIDHARRWELRCTAVRSRWGAALDYDGAALAMQRTGARWLWAVHSETSTGVVNDLTRLRTIATQHDARLALDAVSSTGAMPVDLQGVAFASGASGKALAAYPGLAIVWHDEPPIAGPAAIPRYLDLALAVDCGGVPFTQSSNLVRALHASLAAHDWPARMAHRAHDGARLRTALEAMGFVVVAPPDMASPAVHTVALPAHAKACAVGRTLRNAGWYVSFESGYLVQRNWLQLCLFGEYSSAALARLPEALRHAVAHAEDRPSSGT